MYTGCCVENRKVLAKLEETLIACDYAVNDVVMLRMARKEADAGPI